MPWKPEPPTPQPSQSAQDQLKQQFAALRKQVGDDGSHFPACEKIVQEFWYYDEANRARAVEISHLYKTQREAKLRKTP